ncbi:MAG: A/G-specific adenine glycosylase [Actinobacteria bacterium]|nr:A/G-specific adenine glycosylase [Actinomycetota bacterium]
MLQQTQVARVVPRWEAFLARFPSAQACAAAPASEVVRAWAGLGYNRRALNLHRSAQTVVDRHDSELPRDLEALLALPGVGPYTARAVLVFAFEQDLGLVDTNAGRFLARAAMGRTLARGEAQSVADGLVPEGHGWAWGQAVFDLGAMVCTRRGPSCRACPLRAHCAWANAGFPDPDPVVGSAGVSVPQSTFAGSDRQGRGRLVDALRRGPVSPTDLAAVMGWSDDPSRAHLVADRVVADGLAVRDEAAYRLA